MSVAGLILGYWVLVFTIDIIGRKPIQLGGFIILTILFFIWGFAYNVISSNAMFCIYSLCNFFQNFGPNTTTFIVAGEVFSTRYHSSGHGLSAASGKIGAIISQALIGPLRNKGGVNHWMNHIMKIYGGYMALGILTTLLIPETKRKSLEQLTQENDDYAE